MVWHTATDVPPVPLKFRPPTQRVHDPAVAALQRPLAQVVHEVLPEGANSPALQGSALHMDAVGHLCPIVQVVADEAPVPLTKVEGDAAVQLVEPVVGAYEPHKQAGQLEAPAALQWPVAQMEQDAAPAALQRPAAH